MRCGIGVTGCHKLVKDHVHELVQVVCELAALHVNPVINV